MTRDEFLAARLCDLARITGIGSPRWSRYLRGTISPSTSTLQRAAAKLGMSKSELVEALEAKRSCLRSVSA
jgi:transcriptional regulator with XRE-family HTH domain